MTLPRGMRAEATNVLARWSYEVGRETLEMFIDRENNPTAQEILAKIKAPGDRALNDDEQQG